MALSARALGAERMYLHPPDPDLTERIHALTHRWGGDFEVEGIDDWRRLLREFDGTVVHLTMYGLPLERIAPRIRSQPRLLLVVGGAKVPFELYERARYNVAVGAQPHSEVAALALTLDRLIGPVSRRQFTGGTVRIRPSARGKRVVEKEAPPSIDPEPIGGPIPGSTLPVVARAPGKCILFGEHGVVRGTPELLFALDLETQVVIQAAARTELNGDPDAATAPGYFRTAFEEMWALGPPLGVRTTSRVPRRSGLGSSAAFVAALAAGLGSASGGIDRPTLARRSFAIEQRT
ncbi:tRNA 2'-O-methylase, partial [mine drainage metagenome]